MRLSRLYEHPVQSPRVAVRGGHGAIEACQTNFHVALLLAIPFSVFFFCFAFWNVPTFTWVIPNIYSYFDAAQVARTTFLRVVAVRHFLSAFNIKFYNFAKM